MVEVVDRRDSNGKKKGQLTRKFKDEGHTYNMHVKIFSLLHIERCK